MTATTLRQPPLIPGPLRGYPAIPGQRADYLDALARQTGRRGIKAEFYDPAGMRYGLPTYPFKWAPACYKTRRQLRDMGLRPGGQEPCAQVLWRHRGRRRIAYLYLVALALPKRTATPAQLAACGLALLARMTCPVCGLVKDYCIPTSRGYCNDCADGGLS